MRRKAKLAANLEAKRQVYVISMMLESSCPHRLVIVEKSNVNFLMEDWEMVYRCIGGCESLMIVPDTIP